ncbi:MAG: lysylphosphatidylglycerol synthase transmembrane domain-containing protein, partial [Candidatus Omnitrophica bacterium]|nr:lysylphosphatidylglycerol synthase transmembrane domain-containing protein [Candidatus Omnitrophota bacterium]
IKRSALIKTAIALAVSASILWILFLRIDARKVASLIIESDLALVLLAVFISLSVNIFLGAVKWQSILRGLGYTLPFREVFNIRSGCLPLKVIFPLKSSELLKAFYLKKTGGIPASRAASSIILDKTLNILATLAIFLIGLLVADIELPRLLPVSALLLITLFLFWAPAQELVIKLAGSMHPKLRELSGQLLSAFREIKAGKKLYLIALSLVYQMSEAVNVYVLFKAMSIPVPFASILVFVPLVMTADNIPIADSPGTNKF